MLRKTAIVITINATRKDFIANFFEYSPIFGSNFIDIYKIKPPANKITCAGKMIRIEFIVNAFVKINNAKYGNEKNKFPPINLSKLKRIGRKFLTK